MKVIQADITTLNCEAIVNAANSSLLGGGGVDGAIHNAAGPELVHECRLLGGCKTGMAKITKGCQLKAKYIIHTVGPVWNGGDMDEEAKLYSCYASSLQLCAEHKITSVAFPGISTGIYGFPLERAAQIAVQACRDFLTHTHINITFCCFSKGDADIYTDLLTPIKLEIDRYRGAMLGMAAGDALGTTVEFAPRGAFPPLTDIVGGGPFQLKPGQWTDDTSMALCLGQSIVACEDINLHDQLDRYVDWWKNGHNSPTGSCFDIGGTVRAALTSYLNTDDPHSGSTRPDTAGNGSIMRLAPVPLFYAKDPYSASEAAAESSRSTHGAAEAVDACRLFAHLIIQALYGKSKEEILSTYHLASNPSLKNLSPKIAAIAHGEYKGKTTDGIHGTGYVVQSLEAALWAFYHSRSFEHGALLAVNLGDDADTTGAIYGQIAGAYYGADGIPSHWLKKIAWRKRIVKLADQLYEKKR